MSLRPRSYLQTPCRSSHEERGLKYLLHLFCRRASRRSSHEERGLKFDDVVDGPDGLASLLA